MQVRKRNKSHVLDFSEIKKIYQESINRDSKILDLGCGIPYNLFDSHLRYDCKTLIGIESLENEKEIIDRYKSLSGGELYETFNNLKEIHKTYLTQVGNKENIPKNKIDTLIQEYDNVYNIITNFDISNKEISTLGINDFDIIYLVDILHFIQYKECIRIIQQIPNLLKPKGIIVIQANHSENQSMTNPSNADKIGKRSYKSKYINETIHLFDESGFLKLIKILKNNGIDPVIKPEKHLNQNDNPKSGIKNMLFIGRKI